MLRDPRPMLFVAALVAACVLEPPLHAQGASPEVPGGNDAGEVRALALRALASAALQGTRASESLARFAPGEGGSLQRSASPAAVLHGVAGRTFAHTPLALPAAEVPKQVALRIGPCPFREGADVSFDLPAAGPVELRVYDLAGRAVRTLLDGDWFRAGTHTCAWDGREGGGRSAPAGVYFVRLRAPGGESRKAVARR